MRCGWRGVSTARTVKLRIIFAHRADAGQDRAGAGAPRVAVVARGFPPVIHWLLPLCSAVLPSRLAAIFMRTHGRPRMTR